MTNFPETLLATEAAINLPLYSVLWQRGGRLPWVASVSGLAEAAFDELLHQHGMARVIFDTTPLFSLPATPSPAVQTAQGCNPKFPPRYVGTVDIVFVRFVGQPEVAANARWLEV